MVYDYGFLEPTVLCNGGCKCKCKGQTCSVANLLTRTWQEFISPWIAETEKYHVVLISQHYSGIDKIVQQKIHNELLKFRLVLYTNSFCMQNYSVGLIYDVRRLPKPVCMCEFKRKRAHSRLVTLDAFFNEAELIAQSLVAISHTDLRHVCLAYIIAFWTFLQVIITQEVNLLLWD